MFYNCAITAGLASKYFPSIFYLPVQAVASGFEPSNIESLVDVLPRTISSGLASKYFPSIFSLPVKAVASGFKPSNT